MLGVPFVPRARFHGSKRVARAGPGRRAPYRLWDERFGKDPDIIGTVVRIDGKPRTVVGVLGALPSEYREPPQL